VGEGSGKRIHRMSERYDIGGWEVRDPDPG
jgi:hypothetical protein